MQISRNLWLYSACVLVSLTIGEIQAETKFVDLSHSFNNETVAWPGRKSTFNIETEGFTKAGFWVASRGFCTSEHTSTHIDAPYHFHKTGKTLDQIPFEDLIDIPGVMIDISDQVYKYENGELKVVENYALKREDIIAWEKKNGIIPNRALVLLRTGWETRWGDNKAFLGEKTPETKKHPTSTDATDNKNEKPTIDLDNVPELNFPAFSAEAAKYLTTERNIVGVGVDTISIDTGSNSKTFPAHQIFAARSIYMLEMVANLHSLPPRGFNLWAVPFKIDQGTGAPTRLLAKLN